MCPHESKSLKLFSHSEVAVCPWCICNWILSVCPLSSWLLGESLHNIAMENRSCPVACPQVNSVQFVRSLCTACTCWTVFGFVLDGTLKWHFKKCIIIIQLPKWKNKTKHNKNKNNTKKTPQNSAKHIFIIWNISELFQNGSSLAGFGEWQYIQ